MSRPVVLLHPLGVDHRFWAPVRAVLPGVLGPVVALDLPGHGAAPLPAPGSGIEAYVDAVEQAVAPLGPVHLVGVSLGGLVAQVLAARSPGLVDRLVLADTVAVYPDEMRAMWLARAAHVRSHGLADVAEPMEALWFSAAFRAGSADRVATVRELLLATDPEGYARTCEALAHADATASVGAIAAATLVVCGLDDAPPFRAATTWLEEHLPDGRSAWLEGGHAASYEHPEELARLLVDFLG